MTHSCQVSQRSRLHLPVSDAPCISQNRLEFHSRRPVILPSEVRDTLNLPEKENRHRQNIQNKETHTYIKKELKNAWRSVTRCFTLFLSRHGNGERHGCCPIVCVTRQDSPRFTWSTAACCHSFSTTGVVGRADPPTPPHGTTLCASPSPGAPYRIDGRGLVVQKEVNNHGHGALSGGKIGS